MISLIEPTSTTRYVYFDSDGVITSISLRKDDSNDNSFAYFEFDAVRDFLEGTKKFSDFAVTKTNNPIVFEIVRRNADVRQRSVKNQINKITYHEDPDIHITITDNTLEIEASEDLINRSNVRKNQSVTLSGSDSHPFFITLKDRPDFIISTILIKFSDILSGEKTVINYEHKYEVSVYTKKYFDTYSLRRTY